MNKKRTYDHSLGNNPRIVTRVARRKEFESWKQTQGFKRWRRLQWKIQRGKCAWCREPMNKDFTKVHVDHCLPLYHEGSNNKDNIVLSHADCNIKKWVRVDGMPQWIKNNMINHRRKKMIREQHRIYADLSAQEEIAQELSWIQ